LHFVVPSNLALAVLLIVWTRLVSSGGRASWSLVFGALALTTLHSTVGVLYTLLLLAMAMLLTGKPERPSTVWPWVATGVIAGIGLLLPKLITQLELSAHLIPAPSTAGGWREYWLVSTESLLHAVVRWMQPLLLLPGVIAIWFGYRTAAPDPARSLLKSTAVIALLTGLSPFLVTPGYPGEVFRRVWVLAAVLLTGALGQTAWFLILRIHSAYAEFRRSQIAGPPVTVRARLQIALMAVALAGLTVPQAALSGRAYLQTLGQMRSVRTVFDPDQPARLAAAAMPRDRVLYLHEPQLLFYMTYGGLDLGALYYPVLSGTPAEREQLADPDLRFAVAWSPVAAADPAGRSASVSTATLQALQLELPTAADAAHLRLYVENGGAQTQVQVDQRAPACDQSTISTAPGRASGWIALELPCGQGGTRIEISFPSAHDSLQIGGLTVGEDSLWWPWAKRARLVLMPSDPEDAVAILSFVPEDLLPPAMQPVRAEVLGDQGVTVLLRLEK
jgi:hypothetical protein